MVTLFAFSHFCHPLCHISNQKQFELRAIYAACPCCLLAIHCLLNNQKEPLVEKEIQTNNK